MASLLIYLCVNLVDHSRVKLLPIADDVFTDYINASYIPVSLVWKMPDLYERS